MSEGELKKRIQNAEIIIEGGSGKQDIIKLFPNPEPYKEGDGININSSQLIYNIVSDTIDEAKKDLFDCFGGYSYTGNEKGENGFVQHVSDEVELVLRLKRWFGDST